jgi:ELWxxDGT repeat protein
MSAGQRKARGKSIQQRAARKAERQQRRRSTRQSAARSGAVVAVTALGLSGLAAAPAQAASDPLIVADIVPGADSSWPGEKVAIGSTLFFTAHTEDHGVELWKSNGTPAGTVLVKDINPGTWSYTYNGNTYTGPNSSSPLGLTAVGNTLYFSARTDAHGRELWKSDGTAAGTVMVKDVAPGGSSAVYSYERPIGAIGSTVYFAADDGVNGKELWKTDGTAAGTTLVKDIYPGGHTYGEYSYINSSSPDGFTTVGTTLFFSAGDETHGRELWKSDGTAAGTRLVTDIRAGDDSALGSYNADLEAIGSTVFFAATGTNGKELWRSDGTAAGTTLVKDIDPGTETYEGVTYPRSSEPRSLTAVGTTLFFSAETPANGRELWKSNGTAAGTVMVKDIRPGEQRSMHSYSGSLAAVGGTLFFGAADATNGSELWKSDGTAAGTVMVKDINPGTHTYEGETYANSSSPYHLAAAGTSLFFTAYTEESGAELWALDASGTSSKPPVVTPVDRDCPPAEDAVTTAAKKVKKAKGQLKKAKNSGSATKIKKAKKKLKAAQKKLKSAKAARAIACA